MDLFQTLDESSKLMVEEIKAPYLEALIHTAENLIDDGSVFNEENTLSKETVEKLENLYKEVQLEEYSPDTIRQAMQLALLRGMKEDYIQPNHQMTPDSIGSLMAYLIEIIAEPKGKIHLTDLSVGTGNLLLTVHHFLKQAAGREIALSGVDNDELMLSIASTNSTIQRTPINLLYQDALTNLLLPPADVMVSDLPIGFYPLEKQLTDYQTKFTDKNLKSYSHFMLIEQSFNYMKDGGYGFFLLPSNVFDDENVSVLVKYLQDVGYIQGVIQLPREIFANEESRKAIFIVQKKGTNAKQMNDVLLSSAPDFKDFEAMKSFLGKIMEFNSEFCPNCGKNIKKVINRKKNFSKTIKSVKDILHGV